MPALKTGPALRQLGYGALACTALGASAESLPAQAMLPPLIVEGERHTSPPVAESTPLNLNRSTLGNEALNRQPGQSVDDALQDAGLATNNVQGSMGVGPGIAVQGYTLTRLSSPQLGSTRLLLDGHSDLAYAYNRDPATVDSVSLLRGADATFVGSSSPGGVLEYRSKRPRWRQAAQLGLTRGSDGLQRLQFDAETVLDPAKTIGVRASGALQRGQTTVEGQPTDRDTLLLTAAARTALGTFTVDAEYASQRAPFVFGTLYAGGQFWYDRPYVSPQSRARRESRRFALAWDLQQDDLSLSAWWQTARLARSERLVGFWTVTSPTTASGYYRELTADYSQHDLGLRGAYTWRWASGSYTATVQAQQQRRSLVFEGPQNIAGFSIDLDRPQWPVDLSGLKLTPRSYTEDPSERGLALAHRLLLGETFELRAGSRYSTLRVDSTNNGGASQTAYDIGHWTHGGALVWNAPADVQFWLGLGQSFDPVRGRTREGGWLPPITGLTREVGLRQRLSDSQQWLASLFQIDQNNIPTTDPQDRNALIPLGSLRTRGLAVSWHSALGDPANPWRASLNATRQSQRVIVPTSAGQGRLVSGSPSGYGAVQLRSPEWKGLSLWAGVSGTARRPMDSQGSQWAPGFVKCDAGLDWRHRQTRLRLAVYNLADRRYIQALSAADNMWQGPRRSAQATMSWDL